MPGGGDQCVFSAGIKNNNKTFFQINNLLKMAYGGPAYLKAMVLLVSFSFLHGGPGIFGLIPRSSNTRSGGPQKMRKKIILNSSPPSCL